jgi:predicted metal-binding protein
MDDLMQKLEKLQIDSNHREELRDIIADVQDYGKYAKDSVLALREAEKEAARDGLRYSRELVRMRTFLVENNIRISDLGVEIPNLFGV